MSEIPSLSVTVLKVSCNTDGFNVFASATRNGFLAGAEALVARGAAISLHMSGIDLYLEPFLGDNRSGSLKFLDEV